MRSRSGRPRRRAASGSASASRSATSSCPQAVRSVVPPIINVTIALTKNTSVAAGFFIVVLPNVFQRLTLQYAGEAIPIFIGVALCYLIITVPLGQLGDRLEKRWRIAR